MPKLALMRGDKVVRTFHQPEAPRCVQVSYEKPEPIQSADGPVVECFAEIFERNTSWGGCPCCGAHVYNSKNYMEAPAWLAPLLVQGALEDAVFGDPDGSLRINEKPLRTTASREDCSDKRN